TTGRRGIAGTIFVHKIAGAAAEAGADLADVKRVAEKVIANVRSMGMAIDACTVPAAGKPSFELADDEIEIGIGIHGEPGTHREKISSVNEISDKLLAKIFAENIYNSGDEVAVMVNGMGGTPLMELLVANKHVKEVLASKNIKVAKTLVGNYMTSLDMAGFSITLLKLDDELKKLLNAPADTPAFVQF
ncbi:MAG: dihydroxyacetone kinase subunit DhaK, partial [Synergistaceae bacterium]|nr:dihydroxyacetone kinase subunit DhaK [Synergistaceae bacterium]